MTVTVLTRESSHQAERASLAFEFGQRMRQAREMVNISQDELARRIGHANKSKITRLEAGYADAEPGGLLVRKISVALGVNPGYLLGVDDDIEANPVIFASRMVADALARSREQDLVRFSALFSAVSIAASGIEQMSYLVDGVLRAYERIADDEVFLNEVRGGAKLDAAVHNLAGATAIARESMARLGRKRKQAMSVNQMELW